MVTFRRRSVQRPDKIRFLPIEREVFSTAGVSVAGTTKIGKWLEGDIAEIIAFDRLITDEERYKIESYLAAKYGITLIKSFLPIQQKYPTHQTINSLIQVVQGKFGGQEKLLTMLYNNYITGIVRDDASGLSQIKSTGRIGYGLTEDEGILTISNGSSFISCQISRRWTICFCRSNI